MTAIETEFMQGPDVALFRDQQQLETRRWAFPDGIERLVTLPRHDWRTYAWLQEKDGWSDREFAALTYGAALEYASTTSPGFEAELRECLLLLIRNGYRFHQETRIGNDN